MSKQITIGKRGVYILLAMLAVVVMYVFAGTSPAYAVGQTPEDTWMTNGTVFAQTLSEDGRTLYIGGRFTTVKDRAGNKMARRNLAAIDVATGEPIRTWRPSVTGTGAIVQSIAVKNGRMFVGGNFSAVNGQPRQNLAEVDPVDGSLKPFAPQIEFVNSTIPPTVNTMLVDDSRLYVGGDFNRANGSARNKLAAFSLASGALDNAWRPRTTRVIKDMEFDSTGQTIIVVGRFASVTGSDGTTASRFTVARFYTDTGNVHPWAIPDGVIGETVQTGWDVLVTPTRIYAGFGDKGPNYAAAFRLDNGNEGTQIWRYGTVGDVQTLALSPDGTRLFFGGHFGLVRLEQQVCGGQYLRGLASLNPNTGQLYCDWLPQIEPYRDNGNGPRAEMAFTDNSYLWVGGGFTGISGVPQSNLARFDLNAKSANYAKPKVDLNGLQRSSGLQRGGLNATYFDNIDFTGPEVTRIDPTVNFDFGNGSPDPSMGPDAYSARWTGQVEAPVSGQYTFTTTSDDGVRLYIDGNLVVENWTDHAPTDNSGTVTLDAGRHDVRMEFYERGGGAVARLSWEYPGQARQIVPANNLFYSADNIGGLDATYYDNINFTGAQVERVDPTINFDFGNGSPDPSIDVDTFSARWTGQIEAPVSGQYTFTTNSDDGVRLFVDGKLVVENWSDHAPTDDSGTITLEAGRRYDIQLDFYENGGGAAIKLFWEYPGQTRQVVPSGNLFYSGNVDYSATFGGGPTPIVDANNLAVMDADDANLMSATVTLTNRPDGSAESLSVDTSGTPIVASYDAAQGILGLSGKASKADYQKVLRTVRYNNTSASPSPEDRRVTFVVNDGFEGSDGATATVSMQ